jgi:hypothetical protein
VFLLRHRRRFRGLFESEGAVLPSVYKAREAAICCCLGQVNLQCTQIHTGLAHVGNCWLAAVHPCVLEILRHVNQGDQDQTDVAFGRRDIGGGIGIEK